MADDNFPFIILDDRPGAAPLHRQIYEAIRRAILSGELKRGMRLPATRMLAAQVGVGRTTVVNAYEQLLIEGYLKGRVGAGTYVTTTIPEEMQIAPGGSVHRRQPPATRSSALSRRGEWLAARTLAELHVQENGDNVAFQIGLPAVDEFPFAVWSRLAARRLRHPPRELLCYGEPAGYRPLRACIAAHLRSTRAVQCDADQVIIVAGSQQALDLTARVLLNPGDAAWVEDPCYPGARNALLAAGSKVIPVSVDDQGFDLAAGLKLCREARLVYVTPSHQYPLGVTMSLSRRLALLDWAKQTGAWVVEDDYNSEFRYSGRPLSSLQGLDQNGRVIYVGTFSKTTFPSLRLGCVVVPKDLADAFIAARALIDRHSPSIDQAILTDFIEGGHFARHVRQMRSLYSERQEMLLAAAGSELAGLLEVKRAAAGMHLIGWLPQGVSDNAAAAAARRRCVEAAPLSAYSSEPLSRGGLVLGYAAVNARQIKDGTQRLARALRRG
jgi:GntR family transcriptional regulator / MocR family aminotransferase